MQFLIGLFVFVLIVMALGYLWMMAAVIGCIVIFLLIKAKSPVVSKRHLLT